MSLLWTDLFYFTNTVILDSSNSINSAFLENKLYNYNNKGACLKKTPQLLWYG